MMKHRELTLRLDEERFQKLRLLTFQLEISKQKALEEALELWFAKQGRGYANNRALQKVQQ